MIRRRSTSVTPLNGATLRFVRTTAIAASLLVAVSACSAPVPAAPEPSESAATDSHAPETADVTIAVLSNSSFLPYYVGIEEGIFAERGLNVALQVLAPPTMPAAIMSGEVQGMALLSRCEVAAREGIPLTVVSNYATRLTYQLIGASGIRSLDDLEGKRVITSAASAAPTKLVTDILDRAGLLDKVEIVNIAESGSQVAAFRAGQAEAIFQTITETAKIMDLVPDSSVLVDIDEVAPSSPDTGLCVSSTFLQENPGTVYQLIAGLTEAVALIKENDDTSLPVLMERLDLTLSQAKKVYQSQIQAMTVYPIPSTEMFEQLALTDSQSQGTKVTVDDILAVTDFSIAEEVVKDLDLKE